jgi:nucleoside-diphosphate-sugar epimerase
MKILMLGTAGFIGSHLTARLLKEGYTLVGVDVKDDKISEFLKHEQMTFIEQDIRRQDWNLDELVKDADLVIDLIAYANPGLYVQMPLEVFQLNFMDNLRIAQSCVRHDKRLIQFSSCEVYGKTISSFANGNLKDPEDPELATFSEDLISLAPKLIIFWMKPMVSLEFFPTSWMLSSMVPKCNWLMGEITGDAIPISMTL